MDSKSNSTRKYLFRHWRLNLLMNQIKYRKSKNIAQAGDFVRGHFGAVFLKVRKKPSKNLKSDTLPNALLTWLRPSFFRRWSDMLKMVDDNLNKSFTILNSKPILDSVVSKSNVKGPLYWVQYHVKKTTIKFSHIVCRRSFLKPKEPGGLLTFGPKLSVPPQARRKFPSTSYV